MSHGGKGSKRRPESEPGAYGSGWDAIFGKGKPDSPSVDDGWPESLPAFRSAARPDQVGQVADRRIPVDEAASALVANADPDPLKDLV